MSKTSMASDIAISKTSIYKWRGYWWQGEQKVTGTMFGEFWGVWVGHSSGWFFCLTWNGKIVFVGPSQKNLISDLHSKKLNLLHSEAIHCRKYRHSTCVPIVTHLKGYSASGWRTMTWIDWKHVSPNRTPSWKVQGKGGLPRKEFCQQKNNPVKKDKLLSEGSPYQLTAFMQKCLTFPFAVALPPV